VKSDAVNGKTDAVGPAEKAPIWLLINPYLTVPVGLGRGRPEGNVWGGARRKNGSAREHLCLGIWPISCRIRGTTCPKAIAPPGSRGDPMSCAALGAPRPAKRHNPSQPIPAFGPVHGQSTGTVVHYCGPNAETNLTTVHRAVPTSLNTRH